MPKLDESISYVYDILDSEKKEVIYIGSTSHVNSRIKLHSKRFKGCHIRLNKCEEWDLLDAEAERIVRFNPKENKSLPPNNIYKSERELMDLFVKIESFDALDVAYTANRDGKPLNYYEIDDVKSLYAKELNSKHFKISLNSLIKKLGGNRNAIAKSGDMSLAQLNNLVSQDREVLKLADGNYILVSKHTKIFKVK